eukprot:1720639-Pyramimonas_sp.AAC.1
MPSCRKWRDIPREHLPCFQSLHGDAHFEVVVEYLTSGPPVGASISFAPVLPPPPPLRLPSMPA